MGIEAFHFKDKRALVVGGASGIGAAAARILQDLGAEVLVMDYADVKLSGVQSLKVDLRDKSSIDAAVGQCSGPIHALLSCAGVADGTPGIERVNFIGQRHLIERIMSERKMPRGSAIAMISSVAGLGWERELPTLLEYLNTPDFDAAVRWIEQHPDKATYRWSKQAVSAYVAWRAYSFLKQGVRINAIMPGPTDTPLARANADVWLAFGRDYRDAVGISAASPDEQAYPLIFLCSQAASHINGVSVVVDAGYMASGITGTFEAPHFKAMVGVA